MNVRTPFLNADWSQSVTHGDLVMCRFPFPSTELCRTHKIRPCLVLDRAEHYGAIFLALMPGVQVAMEEQEPTDLIVDQTALFSEYRDIEAVRFLSEYTDRFDTAHRRFSQPDGISPVIGRVSGSMLDAVEHLRGQHLELREQHRAAFRARRRRARRSDDQ